MRAQVAQLSVNWRAVRHPEPAELAWVAILLIAGVVDYALARSDRMMLSTVCRRSWLGRAVAVGLAAHLTVDIPHDPLSALGRRFEPNRPGR